MSVLFKPEILFIAFLFLQIAVVFFVVIKYVIDRIVERRFEELHQKTFPDAQIVTSGQKIPFFKVSELTFLIIGPALLSVSMVYSLYQVLTPGQSQSLSSKAQEAMTSAQNMIKITDNYSISSTTAKKWQDLLDNIPINPNQVLATVSAGGRTKILTSEKPYNYNEVNFSWSGDRAVEAGTKITGYYVYFGPSNTEIPFPLDGYKKSVDPKNMGIFVAANSFSAKNLVQGQTYYLYVQSVSDSQNENNYYKYGLEQVGYFQTLSAKKLFTYIYE